MKRKKLLIFGIFLSFFISCSDELERIPPTTGEVEFKDFGIRDARYYFEENATDLLTSSLRTPKFFVKEFSYFLMPCHQHGLRINLLVQR